MTKATHAAEAPSESAIAEALEMRRIVHSVLASDPPGAVKAAPAVTSRPESVLPPEVRPVYLACALRLLRCADSLLAEGGPLTAEMSDVGEVVRCAAENLTTWLDEANDDPHDYYVFDALDACTAAAALIEHGLDPRNSKTISPIKGVLRLGADRLAEIVDGDPSEAAQALEESFRGDTPTNDASGSKARTMAGRASDAGQERTPAQQTLARLMHRLDVATDKLALVANCEDWSNPGDLPSGLLGQVAIVREASRQITDAYCDLGEWAGHHAGIAPGPWVESFDDAAEVQS